MRRPTPHSRLRHAPGELPVPFNMRKSFSNLLVNRLTMASLTGLMLMFGVAAVSANPGRNAIERPRAEDPYKVPTAAYSEDVWFGGIPRVQSSYLPAPGAVIARVGSMQITERDLYCHLIAAGAPNPALVENWRRARTPAAAAAIREEIRLALAAYVMTQRLAGESTEPLTALEQKHAEILTLPAWISAWSRSTLEPTFNIREVDAIREYRTNETDFYRKPVAEVRIIWTRFDPPTEPTAAELNAMTPEQRQEVRAEYSRQLRRLQEDAVQRLTVARAAVESGELTFEEAALRYSHGPSARQGGRIAPFAQGELSPQFEAAVFEAAPGEFTPILPLPGGAVFAQVIRITPERYLSYEEARADAAEFARRRAVRFSIERALRFVSPFEQTSDTRTWDRRPLDHVMVQAGDLSLTKAEFLQIYPEVEMSRFELDGGILELQAKALALGGHARRLAIEAGLASDPLVIDTRRQAEAVIRSRRALARRWAGVVSPSNEQISAALAETPTRFTNAPRYHVMWVTADIAPQTPAGLRDELARLLVEDFITAARDQAAAEGFDPTQPNPEFEGFSRAGAATGLRPAPAPREGDPVPTELTAPRRGFPYDRLLAWFRNEESSIVVNDLGWLYLEDIPVLRDAVANLPLGEFTTLHTLGGRTGAWIVVDMQEGEPLPMGQAQMLASRELALGMRAEAVQSLLEDMAGGGSLEVLLD